MPWYRLQESRWAGCLAVSQGEIARCWSSRQDCPDLASGLSDGRPRLQMTEVTWKTGDDHKAAGSQGEHAVIASVASQCVAEEINSLNV